MAKKLSPSAEGEAAATIVRVRATAVLFELTLYQKGDEFETTSERAAALGSLVEPADAPAA